MKLEVKKSNVIYGNLDISGSKNAAIPIICACLLTNKKNTLYNVPNITDVYNLINVLKDINVETSLHKHFLKIKAKDFDPVFLMNEVSLLRGSYYLIGVSLYRYGTCKIKYPGGCNFCERPIDIHLKSFELLGYEISLLNEYMLIKRKTNIPKVEINFSKKSVGATINTIFASLDKEEVILKNPSLEPEVLDVISFLQKQGFNIKIVKREILIGKTCTFYKIKYYIMSDRIEAGSYLLLCSNFNEVNVKIKNMPINYMKNVLKLANDLGIRLYIKKNYVLIKKGKENIKKLYNINVYPAIPTDLQQILTCCLLTRNKKVSIKDYVYPDRISHIEEIKKVNGNVIYENETIKIISSVLTTNNVIAKDLRSAFALICLGVQVEEGIVIENAELLFRGYEFPILKLKKLGVNIKTID